MSRTSAVFLVESCQRILGARTLSLVHQVFAVVSSVAWLRFLPRYRNAVGIQCLIIWAKASWTFRSARFLALMRGNIFDPGRWLNCFFLPVLKHGPRSRLLSRVCGWQTCTRNESNSLDFFVLHKRPTSIFGERFEYEHIC